MEISRCRYLRSRVPLTGRSRGPQHTELEDLAGHGRADHRLQCIFQPVEDLVDLVILDDQRRLDAHRLGAGQRARDQHATAEETRRDLVAELRACGSAGR